MKRLVAAVRAAEAELDAAAGRSALNAASKRLMRAKAKLKAAEAERATASCEEAPAAAAAASGRLRRARNPTARGA